MKVSLWTIAYVMLLVGSWLVSLYMWQSKEIADDYREGMADRLAGTVDTSVEMSRHNLALQRAVDHLMGFATGSLQDVSGDELDGYVAVLREIRDSLNEANRHSMRIAMEGGGAGSTLQELLAQPVPEGVDLHPVSAEVDDEFPAGYTLIPDGQGRFLLTQYGTCP